MKTKEFVITLFFVVIILITYRLFPAQDPFQNLVIMAVFLGIIPVLFNNIFLKRKLSDVGFSFGNWQQGLLWSVVCLIVAGALFYVPVHFLFFYKHYTLPPEIINNFKNFVLYELSYVLPVVFLYDIFYRGFIILTLGRRIFYWAIVVQAILFYILVATNKSFIWGLVPYLISAPLAGIVVYKSRSILYSTVMQFFFIVMVNTYLIYLIK
jgi:membrane protease YdiL (CAAX protease family)